MPKTIRIYVAGPLFSSGRSPKNLHDALRAATLLRDADMWPFVPHLFHTWDTVFPNDSVDYWLDMDRVWLSVCDGMLRLPGQSKGAALEEKWCKKLGIPYFFVGGGSVKKTVLQIRKHFDV